MDVRNFRTLDETAVKAFKLEMLPKIEEAKAMLAAGDDPETVAGRFLFDPWVMQYAPKHDLVEVILRNAQRQRTGDQKAAETVQAPAPEEVKAVGAGTAPDVREEAAVVNETDRDLDALIAELGEEIFWFPPEALEKAEAWIKRFCKQDRLDGINKLLTQRNKRKLTHGDLAHIMVIHEASVTENEGGASPRDRFLAVSKSVMKKQFDPLHVRYALLILTTVKFTKKVSEASRAHAERYEILVDLGLKSAQQNPGLSKD